MGVAPSDPSRSAEPQTAWPKVIGIIAMVFGGLAAAEGCMGGVVMTGMSLVVDRFGPIPMIESVTSGPWVSWLIGLSVTTLALGVLLLWGASSLLRRRRQAVAICLAWAVLKILYAFPKALLNHRVNQAQFEAIQDDPNMLMPGGGIFDMMGPFIMVFSVVFTCALPVFLLIWFARPSVRAEVRTW